MRFKRLPSAEIPGQFTLAESGVNFSVADPVNQGFGFSALTPRHQMVFIHAAAGFKLPAAKRAESRSHRRDVAQRFSAAKGAFGNHLIEDYLENRPCAQLSRSIAGPAAGRVHARGSPCPMARPAVPMMAGRKAGHNR